CETILDEHATTCRTLSGDGYDKRDRQAQSMRAGNNEHRNGAHNRVIWIPQKCPDNSGDQSRSERKPEQQSGSTISDPLGARGGVLCLRNEPVDSCQGRIITDGGDLYTQARIRGDGAGGDRIPAFADN